MPIKINNLEYYRTHEACSIAGITKNTFLRWVGNGTFKDVSHRDRRGWRLFTQDDVNRLSDEVNKVRVDSLIPSTRNESVKS
jgi:predicted site-specific integrase-resolvase